MKELRNFLGLSCTLSSGANEIETGSVLVQVNF